MSKTILITGGAASGKSRWAVSYLAACDYVLYLCTSDQLDADTQNRISYSNKQNYVEWDIRTGVKDNPVELFTDHKFFILDNLGAYTSHIMNEMCPDMDSMTYETKKEIEKRVIDDVTSMMDKVFEIDGTMIIITIETGFSVCPENKSQVMFREIIGAVNQRIANICNEVYLSASGIQFKIKG